MMKYLALACLLAASGPAFADETVSTVLDVTVEDASAEALADGAYRLRFRLANDSPQNVKLVGLSSSSAEAGDLTYFSHHGQSEPLTTLFLRPDEVADFDTSHLRARLIGVGEIGSRLPFELKFLRGVVTAEAHVH